MFVVINNHIEKVNDFVNDTSFSNSMAKYNNNAPLTDTYMPPIDRVELEGSGLDEYPDDYDESMRISV